MQGEAERDERLMLLVESALALPPEEREALFRSTLSVDPEFYAEVRRRVEWEERMGGFLKDPVVVRHPAVFQIGELINGRFRILRELGRGGMGVVYEAADEKLDRRIAIKCARAGYQNRLPPEARAALEVSHPNVCKLYELHTGETPAGPVDFLTMEFVDGPTLAERIKREGPLPEKEARAIAVQICDGLEQVHCQHLVHGDLKPANVILSHTPDGRGRAVLTDFGLAKSKLSGGSHFTSVRGGTLDFMAPELLAGARASAASDIYALGVLFHLLVTGAAPKRAGDLAAGTPAAIQPLPPPWAGVVTRCLAPDPNARFQSAQAVRDVLTRRRSVVRWALAVTVLVIAVLALLLWRAGAPPGTPVKLAVLPVAVDGPPIPAAAGLATDLADRLSGLRRNFTVISPDEAARNHVVTVEQARTVLGATHVLRTRLRHSGTQVTALASIADAASGNTIRELKGDYSDAGSGLLAKAMLATVTRAFGLTAGVPREAVSDAAYPYYVQGVERMRRDNLSAEEATPFFDKAMELDPQSALPHAGLAQARMQRFDRGHGRQWLDMAGASIGKAVSINPDSPAVLLASGQFQLRQGRYEQAIADFTRATQLDPANSTTWRSLALGYERTNRATDAIAAYRKGIEAQPGSYWLYLNFGSFHLFRDEFSEAEGLYRRAVELAPKVPGAHMNLGLALGQQGKMPEAEKAMETALSLGKTPLVLMNRGFLYYLEERFDLAAQYFEQSIAAGGPSANREFNLADAYRQLGRTADAKAAFVEARKLVETELTRDPRQSSYRALLALISARLGDAARAEVEIRQASALEPENVMVLREAAITYEVLNQRDKTLEVLSRAPRPLIEELNRHPDAKDLRKDPRFQAMVRKAPVQ